MPNISHHWSSGFLELYDGDIYTVVNLCFLYNNLDIIKYLTENYDLCERNIQPEYYNRYLRLMTERQATTKSANKI